MKSRYKLSEKIVIIINGRGGVGKDTLCNLSQQFFTSEVVSSITPIKEIAQYCGWNGKKDEKSRKFLSDLKRLLVDYNNLPTNYLMGEYDAFLMGGLDILFVQIREKDQIDEFRKQIDIKNITLLIQSNRSGMNHEELGNSSDDMAEMMTYDYVFMNNSKLERAGEEFGSFLLNMLTQENIDFLDVDEESI